MRLLPHMDAPKLKEMGKRAPLMLSLVKTVRASSLPGRTPPFIPDKGEHKL